MWARPQSHQAPGAKAGSRRLSALSLSDFNHLLAVRCYSLFSLLPATAPHARNLLMKLTIQSVRPGERPTQKKS